MFVMFSGPTVTLQESVGGASLEWYQPIHEVGNVFSYPWSLEQLQAAEGGIDLLTSSDPDGFATDSSTHTAEATWAGQQTTTSTSGTASNISWKVSTSVTESAGIFGGAVGSQSFSYNGSVAISTLNTLTTKVGESTGIGIVKPGTFPSPPLYQYPIFPYVFGDNPVPGTLQNLNLGTQLQTSGILRAAYTADPTDPTAGSWWQGAYTWPDVAVNHPARWSTQLITPTAPQPNCIPVAATSRNQACVTFNPPETDIWTSEFHYMKGLLITPAGVSGEGPQLTQAIAGVPLLLRTRVYNYSLADMPSRQQHRRPVLRSAVGPERCSFLPGNAFLIDSVQLPPLPGFNSASSGGTTPNWTTASTEKLDTTSYGDQYLVFWVLVYMTGAQGLVPEMPGHGLTAIPPTLDSIAAATAYLEPYSNNIGFYRSLFYIALASERCLIQPRAGGARLAAGRGIGVPGLPGRQGDRQRARPRRGRRRRALRSLPCWHPHEQGEPLRRGADLAHPRRRRPPREDGVSPEHLRHPRAVAAGDEHGGGGAGHDRGHGRRPPRDRGSEGTDESGSATGTGSCSRSLPREQHSRTALQAWAWRRFSNSRRRCRRCCNRTS